jgi:hypothetical protein
MTSITASLRESRPKRRHIFYKFKGLTIYLRILLNAAASSQKASRRGIRCELGTVFI